MDRVRQLLARDRLRHIAPRACTDDCDHVLGRVGDRQREEADAWPPRRNTRDHGLAAAVRELDVEEDDVRVGLDYERDRLADRPGLPYDLDGVAELAAQSR